MRTSACDQSNCYRCDGILYINGFKTICKCECHLRTPQSMESDTPYRDIRAVIYRAECAALAHHPIVQALELEVNALRHELIERKKS